MEPVSFIPDIPSGAARKVAIGWLILALSSLAGSGLVVILIVLARTPVIYDLIPWVGSFKTALVIHVDLSTLVWFLSFAGVLVATLLPGNPRVHGGGLVVAAVGAAILAFSPFLGEDAPLLNNYVPVLRNGAFFLGIGLFIVGFGITALNALRHQLGGERDGVWALKFGAQTALVLALVAAVLLVWSHRVMPHGLQVTRDKDYYEHLFWSAGHLLQFTHTQFLILCWLWLAAVVGNGLGLPVRWVVVLFGLGIIPALVAPWLQSAWAVDSLEFRFAFTNLMTYGGISLFPAGVLVVWSLLRAPKAAFPPPPERVALWLSLFLGAVGGGLGFMIQGGNVIIPAHYHGSIVSVTLAYMGVTYHLLPRFGFRAIAVPWANRQLLLYGLGSFLHVSGLAWSGGHGVQRKTPGAAQGLATFADKLPMWVMGLGGILAVTGGILFLVLTFRALARRESHQPTTHTVP